MKHLSVQYIKCTMCCSEKPRRRPDLPLPYSGAFPPELRKQRSSEIPSACSSKAQSHNGRSGRRISVFHCCHNFVGVRCEDMQSQEAAERAKRWSIRMWGFPFLNNSDACSVQHGCLPDNGYQEWGKYGWKSSAFEKVSIPILRVPTGYFKGTLGKQFLAIDAS